MITRGLRNRLVNALENVPVVALLEPRQVGKTTLALQIAEQVLNKKSAYLDLELDTDLNKLDDPESYLRRFENQLLIIDEVQRNCKVKPVSDTVRGKRDLANYFCLDAKIFEYWLRRHWI